MANVNKNVWSAGMFLRQENMQEQDRYIEHLLKSTLKMLFSYGWGFARLTLEQQHLALGRIAISECVGIFPDGSLSIRSLLSFMSQLKFHFHIKPGESGERREDPFSCA